MKERFLDKLFVKIVTSRWVRIFAGLLVILTGVLTIAVPMIVLVYNVTITILLYTEKYFVHSFFTMILVMVLAIPLPIVLLRGIDTAFKKIFPQKHKPVLAEWRFIFPETDEHGLKVWKKVNYAERYPQEP